MKGHCCAKRHYVSMLQCAAAAANDSVYTFHAISVKVRVSGVSREYVIPDRTIRNGSGCARIDSAMLSQAS